MKTTAKATKAAPAIAYTPRPAIVDPSGEYSNQRRFGPGLKPLDCQLTPSNSTASDMCTRLTAYRDGEFDLAEVTISIGIYCRAEITAQLNPAELRELAALLLDAAHDIEAFPAAALAKQAKQAKKAKVAA